METKYSVNETLEHFQTMMMETKNKSTIDEIRNFVESHFLPENELQSVKLPDWLEKPPSLTKISDGELQKWAYDLNNMWKKLARKMPELCPVLGERTSRLCVPNNFIIPGGRFKELYYWDTYWIVRGLLVSGMKDTVRGIIENFFYLLRIYGFVPNGSRVYYTRRSQPPLLIPMVDDYIMASGNLSFLKENIHLLEQEFQFWINNRTVEVTKNGGRYTLVQYYSETKGPRPESYREDYRLAELFPSQEQQQKIYFDIKSAAESGWDFSSRWFTTDDGNLVDTSTRNFIPVDLNAFIYRNAILLSTFHSKLGNTEKENKYAFLAEKWKDAVTAVLWNDEEGSWFDFDILKNKQHITFFSSNLTPLWTKCYDKDKTSEIAEKAVRYLTRYIGDHTLGGIPQSMTNSGEQWDFPNAWPPYQHIIIEGLDQSKHPNAQDLAFELALNWTASNYHAYKKFGHMYEKYDSRCPGMYGGGGEYDVQMGFGWTNGVALDLLHKYGDKFSVDRFPRVEECVI